MKLSSCNCCRHKMGAPDGFALIEVVVSLFLVYLIVGLLLNVVTAGMAGLSSSQRQTIAWAYGSSLLEEMKAHPERFIISGETNVINSREAIFHTLPPEGMTAEVVVLGFIRLDPEVL